jgi:hypothetical protein
MARAPSDARAIPRWLVGFGNWRSRVAAPHTRRRQPAFQFFDAARCYRLFTAKLLTQVNGPQDKLTSDEIGRLKTDCSKQLRGNADEYHGGEKSDRGSD